MTQTQEDLQEKHDNLWEEIVDLRDQVEEAEARLQELPEELADADEAARSALLAEHIQKTALATVYEAAADALEDRAEAVASDISDLDLKQRREEFGEIAEEYNAIVAELEEVADELKKREGSNVQMLTDPGQPWKDPEREEELRERKRELEQARDDLKPAYDRARENALLP